MKKIWIALIALLFISEGTGQWLLRLFGREVKGYAAPYGFAAILGLLQILYYPAQILHLPFTRIIAVSCVVFFCAFIVSVLSLKSVRNALKRPQTLVLVFALTVFYCVLKTCSVDMNFADSSAYLNYIAMNIGAERLNLYDITNGLRGEEWLVLYSYQGYYHFVSWLCWIVDLPFYLGRTLYQIPVMTISIYLPGMLYHVLSTMIIVDTLDSIRFRDYGFKVILLVFLLFYSNFAYWDIAFAFYGNTFRNLFIMVMIRLIMVWLDEGSENIKYLIPAVLAAGLACSSSYLFMGFAVLYALAAYLFRTRRENALADMTVFITPMVIYAAVYLGHGHRMLAVAVPVFWVTFLALRKTGAVSRLIAKAELFFEDHVTAVFYIGIPLIFVIGSAVITWLGKNVLVTYSTYLDDFTSIDMTRDFLFLHATWLENLLNVCRWGGYFLLLRKANRLAGEDYLRDLCILMMVLFLNPLCIVMLEATMTGHVFYRNFLTLFNPLTEAYFFVLIYERIREYAAGRAGMKLLLCTAVILGNIGSYRPELYKGQYWIYVRDGKNEDPYYKIDMDEYNALQFLINQLKTDGHEGQPVLLSHSPSTLTYIPEAYQIFTPRNEFFVSVDDDFFEIARRHFEWRDPGSPHYERTCDYIAQYDVDYIVVQYWENSEYDAAADGCSVVLYEGSRFRVRQVVKE